MAKRPNHEFLNPLRRADEARIARSIKPAQRVEESEAARARRQETRVTRIDVAGTTLTGGAEPRRAPRTIPTTRRVPARQGQARGRRPGWVMLFAILAMAAGFAAALYYLGSADLGNSSDSPATLPDWELKGK
ncbi:MAG: hypothetical protein IT535_05670 [Bauldia sp.]|nr:hypothetical protein [Bauldia sp.]